MPPGYGISGWAGGACPTSIDKVVQSWPNLFIAMYDRGMLVAILRQCQNPFVCYLIIGC